jgi:hypothetical protein
MKDFEKNLQIFLKTRELNFYSAKKIFTRKIAV